jgi:hypothetical protein
MSECFFNDFTFHHKTTFFVGPSQGRVLFEKSWWNGKQALVITSASCNGKYGDVLEHMAKQAGATAHRLSYNPLTSSWLNSSGLETKKNSTPLDLGGSVLNSVIIALGDHETVEAARQLASLLRNEENRIENQDIRVLVVPTSLMLSSFLRPTIITADSESQTVTIIRNPALVADYVWLNPTFTLRESSLKDVASYKETAALFGDTLSPFTVEPRTNFLNLNDYSPYDFAHSYGAQALRWHQISDLLRSSYDFIETPESYELRGRIMWSLIVGLLPHFYQGENHSPCYELSGPLQEAAYVASALSSDVTYTHALAEFTIVLISSISRNQNLENLNLPVKFIDSLQGILPCIPGKINSTLEEWSNWLVSVVGPLKLPNTIRELLQSDEAPTNESLWKLVRSVQFILTDGENFTSKHIKEVQTRVVNMLQLLYDLDGV